MLRIAARWADQWDTFPELAGAATEGVTTTVAERLAAFESAARAAGRDPAAIRRSVWAGSAVLAGEAAYEDFVRRHLGLGFTDVAVAPADTPPERLAAIARMAGRLRAELGPDAPRNEGPR
jgi:hypothetical protein